MLAKVQKWGNSLALRIPRTFVQDARLENNATVELTLVDGRIVITPVVQQPWTLEGLLAGITDDNQHRAIETGEAVSREIW